VDDFLFTIQFPVVLAEFMKLFQSPGLTFDLSEAAKSSVYSVSPLPHRIVSDLRALQMRCQNDGISPCKIPRGSAAFMTAFATKVTKKLRCRFTLFRDLLPALLKVDRNRRKPTHRNLEYFLNLVCLSFLSMSTYILRTLSPSFCATYRQSSTDWALQLIQSVFLPLL
jgi:hypothetical protein